MNLHAIVHIGRHCQNIATLLLEGAGNSILFPTVMVNAVGDNDANRAARDAQVAVYFEPFPFPNLTRLSLARTNVTPHLLEVFLRNSNMIEDLDVHNCSGLGSDAMTLLSEVCSVNTRFEGNW